MGAPRLDDLIKLDRLLAQRGCQLIHHIQQLVQPPQRPQADGGGDGVVGGLGHVDMVVRVDPVFAQLAAQDLGGPVGDHLVGVHIVAGAGAGLERVDDELVIPAPIDDLLGSLDDGSGARFIQQPQVAVDFGGSALDGCHRPDERPPGAQPGDGEIVHGALGLHAVQGLLRHLNLTQRIALNTVLHRIVPPVTNYTYFVTIILGFMCSFMF